MGLILDSSVLISAERQGKNARQMLTSIADKISETEVGISVVTLIELAHAASVNQMRDWSSRGIHRFTALITTTSLWGGSCRHSRAKSESAEFYCRTSHRHAHPSCDRVSCASHRAARRRKSSARSTNPTFSTSDRRNGA